MANPQPDKFIRISTELFEALCRMRIPAQTRQVLDAIIRKTYGFGKKKDSISLSQLSEMTGLNRRRVCESVHQLIQMQMVSAEKRTRRVTTYCLQKDYERWRVVRKNALVRKNARAEKRNNLVRKNAHTIDTLTIDNNIIADDSVGQPNSQSKLDPYEQLRRQDLENIVNLIQHWPCMRGYKNPYSIAGRLVKIYKNDPVFALEVLKAKSDIFSLCKDPSHLLASATATYRKASDIRELESQAHKEPPQEKSGMKRISDILGTNPDTNRE